jgi:hypothetical protein
VQNSQHHRRLSFVDATYADLPRPVHWVFNGMGVFLLAAPFLFMFLSWFLVVLGIDMLQSVIGMAGASVVFALLDMLKLAALVFALALSFELWASSAELIEEVHQVVDNCCEDFVSHLR